MKAVLISSVLAAGQFVAADETSTNPLAKVLQLMDKLATEVTEEGRVEAKAYKEYFDWCDNFAKDTGFAVKTTTRQKGKLEAKIGELSSTMQAAGAKVEELAASISTTSKDLETATKLREKEAANFQASEKELMEVTEDVGSAIHLIEKQAEKNPAAFAQLNSNAKSERLVQSLGALVDAAGFPGRDRKRLLALVQSRADSDDGELAAPEAESYKSHSDGILDLLEDMREKADGQLSDLRKAETTAKNNFAMLKQSLDDQLAADNKEMDDEKTAKAEAEEGKASAEGDLERTTQALKNSEGALANGREDCMQTAADHEATVKAREEELKVIAEAQGILKETTEGAVSQSYSMLQVGAAASMRIQSHADLARTEVVTLVKRLARDQHSAALAQLASRITAVLRFGAASHDDTFGKVKTLIKNMITALEKKAAAETSEKAYCDEEMSKTGAKKGELEERNSKLTSKIDKAAAKSAQLKEEVKELQSELSALAKSQAEADKLRQESHGDYVKAKEELEQGLTGVRKALDVLRDYYASKEEGAAALLQDPSKLESLMQQPKMPEQHSKSTGAGQSIIGILELCESDFAKNLAKEETQESDAQSEYEKMTQENKVSTTTKNEDVKYKTQESKSLDKTFSELTGDRETTSEEFSAVLEYWSKIKERCIAKPETYEERSARREAEIKGLKEAITILEEDTAFIQQKRKTGNMRGSLHLD